MNQADEVSFDRQLDLFCAVLAAAVTFVVCILEFEISVWITVVVAAAVFVLGLRMGRWIVEIL